LLTESPPFGATNVTNTGLAEIACPAGGGEADVGNVLNPARIPRISNADTPNRLMPLLVGLSRFAIACFNTEKSLFVILFLLIGMSRKGISLSQDYSSVLQQGLVPDSRLVHEHIVSQLVLSVLEVSARRTWSCRVRKLLKVSSCFLCAGCGFPTQDPSHQVDLANAVITHNFSACLV
jgi:hypothetical protein